MRKILPEISIRYFFSQFRKRAVLTFAFSVLILTISVALVVFLSGGTGVKAEGLCGMYGPDKIVNGDAEITCATEINGRLTVHGNLTIKANVTVTHELGHTLVAKGMELIVDGTLTLESGAQINVDGMGYKGGRIKHLGAGTYDCIVDQPCNVYPPDGSNMSLLGKQKIFSYVVYYFPSPDQRTSGGNWNIGGTGGGNGTFSLNRGAAGGGGGGAFGNGAGAKTNGIHDNYRVANYGGGGAGWGGTGGTGGNNADGGNGTINDTSNGNIVAVKFGGGGGVGTANFGTAWDIIGGNGGGVIKIVANKLVMGINTNISADGTNGGGVSSGNRSGLGGGGGGGTIAIDVNELEMEQSSNLSMTGGAGYSIWYTGTTYYNSAGSGGGGIAWVDVANKFKKAGLYYGDAAWQTQMLENIDKSSIVQTDPTSSQKASEAQGGDGKVLFNGNPTVPATCDFANDASVEIPGISLSTNAPGGLNALQAGDIVNLTASYYQYRKSDTSCETYFYTKYNPWNVFNISNEKIVYTTSGLEGKLPPNTSDTGRWWETSTASVFSGGSQPNFGEERHFTLTANLNVKSDLCTNYRSYLTNPPKIFTANYVNSDKTQGDAGVGRDYDFSEATIGFSCPNLNIENEVGAQSDITNSTSNLKFVGPSVVSRNGTTAINKDANVIDLSSYTHSFDFSAIETNFEKLKKQRATDLSGTVSGIANLNPITNFKPEGGVFNLTTDAIDGGRVFNGRGTIFREGNLTINKMNWNCTAGTTCTLGIVVKDGDVTINASARDMKNVAIYAYGTGGTIKIFPADNPDNVAMTGSFVGNSIEIGQASGTIKYAPSLNTAPPPGFSSLVEEIQGLQ